RFSASWCSRSSTTASSSLAGTRICKWWFLASSSSWRAISTSCGTEPMPADILHAGEIADTFDQTMPALEMRGIDKRFPGVIALENVDLTLQPGKVHALMGENGAGKSTLIKIMAGVYGKDAGAIRIQDREVDINSPRDSLKEGIKVVFQEIALISEFTVAENIFLEGYPTGKGGSIDWKKIRADSAALFKRIGFNVDPAARTGSLPVSQQQMVEIARALAHEARIVVMDEPTSSLTPNEVSLLFTVIRRLTALGIAVVYVSHKLDEVFEIADTVTVLRDGRRI